MKKLFNYIIYFCFIYSLSSCSTLPFAPTGQESFDAGLEEGYRISPKARIKDYDSKAALAENPSKRAYYQLLAMELVLQFGNVSAVEARLENMNARLLDDSYQYRVDLIHAQIALFNDQAPVALQKLPKNNPDYPLPIQSRILRTRATALSKLGYLEDALSARLQLDKVLIKMSSNEKTLEANHQQIWSILHNMPTDTLKALAINDDALPGWIELSLNLRKASVSGLGRDLAVTNWLNRFPQHPAATTFGKLLRNDRDFISEYPKNIGVLLPLSGLYAGQATAVRDGFLSSYFGHDTFNRPNIKIYDTGNNPENIWLSYQKAVEEGAEMIVGPLQKTAVSELIRARNLTVPVLALNYSSDKTRSVKVVQFGLLPEDEARQAAELAIIKNQTQGIVFVPNTPLGERLGQAFISRYKELGGYVLAMEKYATNTDDHGHSIQRALHILQSENRESILRTVLKRKLKFEPRRREDVDVIFLIANPRHARNFRTQLKFHNSGDVSIYTTSQAFSGIADSVNDQDLDGLVFTDMPWTLQGSTNSDFAAALQNWPQVMQKYARLYALGIDAYRIIPYLNQLRNSSQARFPGLTGSIALGRDNKIHRELLWATFNEGRPQVLEFASAEDHNLFDPEDDISYLESPN